MARAQLPLESGTSQLSLPMEPRTGWAEREPIVTFYFDSGCFKKKARIDDFLKMSTFISFSF